MLKKCPLCDGTIQTYSAMRKGEVTYYKCDKCGLQTQSSSDMEVLQFAVPFDTDENREIVRKAKSKTNGEHPWTCDQGVGKGNDPGLLDALRDLCDAIPDETVANDPPLGGWIARARDAIAKVGVDKDTRPSYKQYPERISGNPGRVPVGHETYRRAIVLW